MNDTFVIPRTAMEVFEMLPQGTLCEVIDNALYMSPSPTTGHQRIILKVSSRLEVFLSDTLLGEAFVSPCDMYLNIDGESVVQPDILFIKAERSFIVEERGIMGAPDFVIEILSSNEKHDKTTKLELYERNSIPEYFIIDPDTKAVLHYLLDTGIYALQEGTIPGLLNIAQLNLQISF